MAKQSGLHQIRGKVGGYSYYKQTGVQDGIIRAINNAMSARVKNDEAYANTRLNNAEFGQACEIAGVLGKFVTPKFRPMILPFSQSKMAKTILETIKLDNAAWGKRNLTANDAKACVDALNMVSKNNPADYGFSIVYDSAGDQETLISNQAMSQAKLDAIGADGFNVRVLTCSPWIGTAESSGYGQSFARANILDIEGMEAGETDVITIDFRPAPPAGWPAFRLQFFVVVLMPYRIVNGRNYVLQEHCTFFAQLPDQEA